MYAEANRSFNGSVVKNDMKDQTSPRTNRIILIAAVVVLILLALAKVSTSFLPPDSSSPFLLLLSETHNVLALVTALYVAHRVSPKAGLALIIGLIALHIPYMVTASEVRMAEVVRQAILLIAALLGIRIIEIRNRLEAELKKSAAELESQRILAFKLVDELIILNGIATIGVETSDEDALLRDAVQIIDSALHPDYFDIFLLNETRDAMRVYHSPRTADHGSPTIPVGQGITGQVMATGKVRRIADVSLEPAYLGVNPGVRSELCVPLKVRGQAVGVINVEDKRLNAFNEDDEHLMLTFADQLVTAMENVRLLQSEQRHAREAEILREAGSIVAATLSQEETIERILVQLKRVIPYDSASVQLLGDGYMEIVGVHGWADPNKVLGVRFPVPGNNPNTVIVQERKPYVMGNAPSVYKAFGEGPHSHIHSFLGAPLIVGKKIIGMLAVDNTQPDFFDESHVRLVTAFADQVALAINNARLFSEVEQLAHTDGLTGLHNRRHFMDLAKHEFERAKRYQHPLTAIMLDIDHFKNVNDTYGHAVGDQVLQVVSTRCKKAVREVDVLGRYGGEEFASLLLETEANGGRVVAERLRKAVAEPSINTDDGEIIVTISLGIAVLDKDCRDLDDLLRRADRALYAAKQGGRNQVAVWRE
jgi:diguanylate cyclase (GGDEF)-like protein